MNKTSYAIVFILSLLVINCEAQPEPTVFPDEALNDTFLNEKGEGNSLETILKAHEGKTILIDVWASWCRDCIVGLPSLKALQKDHDEVVYVFLSMDKTEKSWKSAIDKYDIKGEHYFMSKGWNSAFSEAIDLDWVPRYMVIDAKGKIVVFNAIEVTDPRINQLLK